MHNPLSLDGRGVGKAAQTGVKTNQRPPLPQGEGEQDLILSTDTIPTPLGSGLRRNDVVIKRSPERDFALRLT